MGIDPAFFSPDWSRAVALESRLPIVVGDTIQTNSTLSHLLCQSPCFLLLLLILQDFGVITSLFGFSTQTIEGGIDRT